MPIRAPRITIKRIAEVLALGAVLVGAVVWLTDRLDGKASVARADRLEERQRIADAERADIKADMRWIQSTLLAIAQRVGAIVPTPPSTP